MGLGILSDPYLGDDVPGTSPLDDIHSINQATILSAGNSNLKRNKDGIVLIPQPSSSPDDPLNWPRWKKYMLMVTMAYGAGVAGAFGPVVAAGVVQVAESLDTSIASLSMMAGDLCLAFGLVLLLTAPASVIWGRRPIFLLGSALMLASSIWSALAKDANSFIASRIVAGMGLSPLYCLVEATISDIFFVHERGTWISLWGFAVMSGFCGVSIANGYLIQYVSWRACFVIVSVLIAIQFVLTILFFPETAFIREKVQIEEVSIVLGEQKAAEKSSLSVPTPDSESTLEGEGTHKQSYWRSLSPWTGRRYSNTNFWKIALRPFTLICSPIVAWGALINGTTDTWLVAISVSISMLFSSPAYGYNFAPGPVGLISGVGPLIAAMLGNALAGPLSDWSVTWLSRRNGGIYEPEFRLFIMIPVLITSTIGWFGWAISTSMHEMWIAPTIFYSLFSISLSICSVGVVAYVVDAHGRYAAETFATISIVKSVMIFILSYFFIPWLTNQGVLRTFCTIGGINLWVCLMTIPMYIFGKRARSWVHRTPWMLT